MKIYKYTIYKDDEILETVYDAYKDEFDGKYVVKHYNWEQPICPINKLDSGELADGERVSDKNSMLTNYDCGFCYSESKTEDEIKKVLREFRNDVIASEIESHIKAIKRLRNKRLGDMKRVLIRGE